MSGNVIVLYVLSILVMDIIAYCAIVHDLPLNRMQKIMSALVIASINAAGLAMGFILTLIK